MIIIPTKNGYFIGNIPYFQTNPYHEISNPILRDIWLFLEISQLALHTINSISTEETGNADGKLEFREHIKATKTWKPKKIQKNWKKL